MCRNASGSLKQTYYLSKGVTMMKVTEFEPFIAEHHHQRLHQSLKGKNSLEKARGFAAGIPYSTCSSSFYIAKNKKKSRIGIGKSVKGFSWARGHRPSTWCPKTVTLRALKAAPCRAVPRRREFTGGPADATSGTARTWI